MAPSAWDDEESDSSSPSVPQITRRSKFDDEEEEDVLESWDAAEDSEVEREKAKKAAEAKAKAEAEAKANHKSKAQRIEERRQENMRKRLEAEESDDEEEDEATKRERLRREMKESDLKHAEDLFSDFGNIGINPNRSAGKAITVQDESQPGQAVDLTSLPIFNPNTKAQFDMLRDTLAPLLVANSKKAHYTLFMQEFAKQICKEMPSDQIKKVASGLTTLSNEKMKEEKAAEKGGKKSKAAKSKVSLSAGRSEASRADTTNYDDGLDDDDFM